MSDNHVPTAVRKAISSVLDSDSVISVEGASNYDGAKVELKRLTQMERTALERNDVTVGTVTGVHTSERHAVRVHIHE